MVGWLNLQTTKNILEWFLNVVGKNGKEPVDTANGKFVRGVWHETYLYAGRYYMFLFDCNGISRLKVYAEGSK